MEETTFYLFSPQNRILYPSKRYPLTHSIYYQTVLHQISKESSTFQNFYLDIFCLFLLILFMSLVHQTHIQIYDSIHGPHHLNLQNFIKHVSDFDKGQNKIQYIQVELGQYNYYPSASDKKYGTIQEYQGGQHIATYDYLKTLNIHIKVPSRLVSHIHTKLPFNFSKFTISTLQCIWETISRKENMYKRFIEKSDYVKYINLLYANHVNSFNTDVSTNCGIFIGYLYKPLNEVGYLPKLGYNIDIYRIVLDTSIPYIRYYSFLIFGIYMGSIVFATYRMMEYCIISVKYQFFSSFPLLIQKDVLQELQKLGARNPPLKQLLKLDELLVKCKNQCKNQLFVIKNHNDKDFLVILPNKRDKMKSFKTLPFFIYPISAVENVTVEGIYYSHHHYYKWPNTSAKEKKEFACWLHENLIQKSDNYRHFADREVLEQLTTEEEIIFEKDHYYLALSSRHPEWSWYLNKLITNHPVPVRRIAKFRLREFRCPRIVDETIITKFEICPICMEKFVLNEQYEVWPCSSKKHVFHYDCILKQFRTNNACPCCRKPAEF